MSNTRTDRTFNKKKRSKLIDLMNNSYIGVVEDIDDEENIGRCKIRVFGVYDDVNGNLGTIPSEDLPWAYPLHDIVFGSKSGTGKFSTPKKGAKVRMVFENDIYHPRYFAMEEIDDELADEIAEDYEGFHSLVYDSDEDLKIFYAKNTGLMIELKDSIMNIEPGGEAIIIDHDNGSCIMEMRGNDLDIITKNTVNISTQNNATMSANIVHVNGVQTDIGGNPIYSNVNGEQLMILLKAMAAIVDAKLQSTPGQTANLVQSMEQLILSATVSTSP